MAWDTTQSTSGNMTQANTGTGTLGGTGTNNSANQYSAAQQQMQGQLPSLYQQLLTGGTPNSWTTVPQEAINNYQNQFDAWKAPQLAAKGGAGSPMMAANQAMGLSNLLSNLYPSGVQQYQNALGAATNFAMTPQGVNNNTSTNQNTTSGGNMNQQYSQDVNQKYTAIQDIINLIKQTGI